MGAVAAIVSKAPAEAREQRLRAMAELSPYRGALRTWHFPGISFGCQARDTDATTHETDALLVLVHGRPYVVGCDDPSAPGVQGAVLMAELWERHGQDAFGQLDGEYGLLVHDKVSGETYACVSLMMTKQLYQGQGRIGDEHCLALASEVRQVACGAGVERRLDPEQLVQSLCLGGPVLDRRRTEYVGIDRLLAPEVYRLDAGAGRPLPIRTYWSMPPMEPLDEAARAELPERLMMVLRAAMRAAPAGGALSLSGGYDSGTLWAVAYADRTFRPMPKAFSIPLPGSIGDETETITTYLGLTGQTGRFLDRNIPDPSAAQSVLAGVDRIPLAAGLERAALFPVAMRDAGLSSHILGFGAELCITGYAYYIAERLRRGRFVSALGDWLRFEPYFRPCTTRVDRLKLLWRYGLKPAAGPMRWLRPAVPPLPLKVRWLSLFREAESALAASRQAAGPSRGLQSQQVWAVLNTGLEPHEQLNERYGVETQMPFLHRGVMDFGLRLSLRDLACGFHEKELMRRAAMSAFGFDPPWPRQKNVPKTTFEEAREALAPLGPPMTWQLVQQGMLDRRGLDECLSQLQRGQTPAYAWVSAAVFERFLRQAQA